MTQTRNILIGIIGAAALATIAFLLLRGAPDQHGTTDAVQNATSTPADTLALKTYTDSKGSFTFQYPETWQLKQPEDPKGFVSVSAPSYQPLMSGEVALDEVYVAAFANPNHLSVQQVFNNFDDGSGIWFEKYPHQKTTINGKQAYVFAYTNPNEKYATTVTIINCGNKIATVDYNHADDRDVAAVNQLVSSLICK